MTPKPTLTEADIHRWTGETFFRRGEAYFHEGAILYPRRQGNTLKARCQGSDYEPYRVEVTLGPGGITAGDCSCPVGSGHCKHVAALLLTWLHDPDAFTEVADLETSLARRSKEELIVLIRQMVERYPDLEMLLELPIPTAAGAQPPLDSQAIRRQARRAFQAGRGEWINAYDAAANLRPLIELANGYVERQNWRDAATVYEVIIQETLDNYETIEEEGGELSDIVNDSVSGLGECLAAITDPVLRQSILRVLFDTYHWDIDFGGIDMGYEATDFILRHATPAERQTVMEWVKAALPTGDAWGDNYHRQAYGGFLLTLQADSLDDAAFIALCRQTGRLNDLVERLLDRGRLDEATAEARQAEDYSLLNLAPLFVAHGQGDLIEQIILDRLATSQDRRLAEWLRDRLLERNDLAGALPLEEQLFWQTPNTATYQKLKDRAQALDRWESLRPEVLTRLEREKKYGLLTEIYLLENEVGLALDTLPLAQKQGPYWGYSLMSEGLSIQVARAAEVSYPSEAIDLYMDRVKRLIDSRGRENYATAAKYLLRVRELYQGLKAVQTWEKLIADIYENYRQLRALKEELAKVGL